MKPLVLHILTDEGSARVSVRLVDTMLIAPAGASLALLGANCVCQRLICLTATQKHAWMFLNSKSPRNSHVTR